MLIRDAVGDGLIASREPLLDGLLRSIGVLRSDCFRGLVDMSSSEVLSLLSGPLSEITSVPSRAVGLLDDGLAGGGVVGHLMVSDGRGGMGSLGGAGDAVLGLPLLGRGGLVDVSESLLVWAGFLSGLGGAAGEEVTTDQRHVGEQLSGFRVGEDEREEGAEVLNGCEGVNRRFILRNSLITLTSVLLDLAF